MAGMDRVRGWDEDEHFYEDDEPLEGIVAAFQHGEHGVTAPPISIDTHGWAPEPRTSTQPGIVRLRPAEAVPVRAFPIATPA